MIVFFGRNERHNKLVCDIPMSSLGTNIFLMVLHEIHYVKQLKLDVSRRFD